MYKIYVKIYEYINMFIFSRWNEILLLWLLFDKLNGISGIYFIILNKNK